MWQVVKHYPNWYRTESSSPQNLKSINRRSEPELRVYKSCHSTPSWATCIQFTSSRPVRPILPSTLRLSTSRFSDYSFILIYHFPRAYNPMFHDFVTLIIFREFLTLLLLSLLSYKFHCFTSVLILSYMFRPTTVIIKFTQVVPKLLHINADNSYVR
jgi:hypothetical protein